MVVVGQKHAADKKPTAAVKVELYRTQSYWDLFDAIGFGTKEMLINILQNTKDPKSLLRKKDLQGLTPLKKAIALSRPTVARILVSYGAEPSTRDPLGRTALHAAAMQGRRELMAPLLVSSDSSVNLQDNDGWTPLHMATRGHHEKAINWLLYAGADVNLKNKHEQAPEDLLDEESPLRQLLQVQSLDLDNCPVELCSAFIGPKQLNMIGSRGSLMFVTSGLWSDKMQFFFNIRMRPYHANPGIPLRQDEMFFDDLYHYRMMYRLPNGMNRVHAYFLSFEFFRSTEVILKITSKSNYLGEVPVTLSMYTQDNFTCFLASAEMELQDAGQFVLVKRPTPVLLTKGLDGVYSNKKYPMFKIDLPPGTLPSPAQNWNEQREERARAENQNLLRKMMSVTSHAGEDKSSNNKNTNSVHAEGAPKTAEPSEVAEGEVAQEMPGEDGSVARTASQEEEPQILDGDEPDDCQDFYYISRGYGLYLEYRTSLPVPLLLDKAAQERNIIHCTTGFYKIYHTSGQQLKTRCRIQIPKSDSFQKYGTVLVLMRTELEPDEEEFPDPDDQADEHFLSQDGKNSWGQFWLGKEKERWSLMPSGICNKRTRVLFESNSLCTYIVVQLKSGNQKWEPESDDEVSSDEEEATQAPKEVSEKGEGEEGGDAESKRSSVEVTSEARKDSADKKRDRKQSGTTDRRLDYGDDDISDEEVIEEKEHTEPAKETKEEVKPKTEEEAPPPAEATEPEEVKDGEAPQVPQPEAVEQEKNESASNLYGQERQSRKRGSNKSKGANNSRNQNTNNPSEDREEEEATLTPEELTIFKNLAPLGSNFALTVGSPFATRETSQQTMEASEKEGEEAAQEPEGDEDEEVEVESDEDLPHIPDRIKSFAVSVEGKTILKPVTFGPTVLKLGLAEADEAFLKHSVAVMWRYRNHREATTVVFSRPRDGGFDLVIEVVRSADLYVRAEHWWSQDYNMVAESVVFPCKSGRLFSFAMEGSMVVEQPPGSSPGYIVTRNLYCYFSRINSLQYFVHRGVVTKDGDEKGAKKGAKKKDDGKHEPSEPDAILEINGYPRGTRTNGADVATMPILLTGADLWYSRHMELRKSDDYLLASLVKFLRKESELVKRWWKLIIMLGYSEKVVETEKGKAKNSIILATYLKKWFQENLNSPDRGIMTLVTVLHVLGLETSIEGVVNIMKSYKAELLAVKHRPRYLLLLFHWIIKTKMTRNNLIRMMGPQILKPVSDVFLLRLAELVNPQHLFKIGACMELEDNVIHAVEAEEVILDPDYLSFRLFIKCRQKKDEVIHYTLLLINMVKNCEEHEAKTFLVQETRKWMETVADTEPEICAKLHNIFD